MEVDYSRYVFDPSKGIDDTLQSLSQALMYRDKMAMQKQQMQRQAEQDAQAKQLHDLQVAKLQDEQNYQKGLKDAIANPQSTTELKAVPVQPVASLASLGLNRPDYVSLPNAAPRTPQEQSDIDGLQANVNKYPGLAKLAGADDRLQQMKAASPTAQPQPSLASLGGLPEFAPQPPNVQAPMLPGVEQKTTTESPAAAASRYALEQGRTEDATKYINLNEAMAKQAAIAKAYGTPEKAAEYETSMDKMTKASTLLSSWKKAGGMQFAMAQAAKMPDLFGKVDMSQLTSDGQINKYALPNGQYAVWSDDNPGTIHLTAAPSESVANAHQVQEIPSADGRTAQKFQYNPQTKRYDIPLGDRYLVKSQVPNVNVHVKGSSGHGGMNIKMNGLDAAQTDALTTAIAEGRLDPYKINSKNQQILADAALKTPGINLNDMAANLGLARNKDVQMKGAIAETVPPLLQKIVEEGKKLNYSDNQFVGMAQQWIDKKTNNPTLVKYMTLRNDQLLTLGGIMRSNGMTDMAQKLEEEAAHPTMSPRALEAWLEGQMESVNPRLNIYRSIRDGKGAPRAAATPSQPAPTAPQQKNTPAPKGKQLDENTARQFLQRAGGNKDKARMLAKQAGYIL